MKLSICIPARDTVHTAFAKQLAFLTSRLTSKSIDYDLHIIVGSVIVDQRTALVNEALKTNPSHILWLDSDIHFPHNVFERLVAHDKDIVAANYSTRYAPYRSVAFTDPNDTDKRFDKKTGLHKIWGVGMGCMLTKASVYSELPKPWFSHEYNKGTDTFGGEDIYFCNQAMHHGIDVWLDADIMLAHIGTKAHLL